MLFSFIKELLEQKEFVLSKQFLRAATSIGANVSEATAAQTKKDFAAKMSIASKEARETHYWLRLLIKSRFINDTSILASAEERIRLLTSIVKTTQENLTGEGTTTKH